MFSQTSKKNKKKTVLYLVIVAIVVIASVAVMARNSFTAANVAGAVKASALVERRDLTISVTEPGEVEARYTTDILCQVEGRDITIISLIPEGTILTKEDVANGTILIELDSSQLKEQVIQKDMSFNTAKASYEEAIRNYEIQIEQNISDITAAELREEFALMDLRKYLGTDLAEKMLAQNTGPEATIIPEVDSSVLENIDEDTKGEALQNMRDFHNNIENAQENLQRAESKLLGTQKLFEKSYVTKMELDADEAAANQAERNLKSRETALQLFLAYDFEKQAKQLYSNYQEAIRQTKRTKSMAEARLAQASARRDSADVRLRREEENLNRTKKSLDACIIRAPAAGMVVYGKETMGGRGGTNNFVELGGQVRERQKLITIPSTGEMAIRVKVHEAWIDMITLNQVALITLDAYPDQTFTGSVYDVALLPSSADRFMSSSDLKVYPTMVSVDGSHSQIRDGMSAKVEIIIDQLKNVICVPTQAVANLGAQKVCYVLHDDNTLEPREVEVGAFNNNYIEIKSGLNEGEKVSLVPERQNQTIDQVEQQKKDMIEKAIEDRGGVLPGPGTRTQPPQMDSAPMDQMTPRGDRSGTDRQGRGAGRQEGSAEPGRGAAPGQRPGGNRTGPPGETEGAIRGGGPAELNNDSTTEINRDINRQLQNRMPPVGGSSSAGPDKKF